MRSRHPGRNTITGISCSYTTKNTGVLCDANATLHQIVEVTIPWKHERITGVLRNDSMPNLQGQATPAQIDLMKLRTPSFQGDIFESTYSLEVNIKHDNERAENQMVEIPITVLSGDPRQAQIYLPLAHFNQLNDDRQRMINQQMWPTHNLEYPQHQQLEENLKKDSADESVAYGHVL